MLSFSSFIKETLNYDQQHYIDHFINWDDPTKRDVDFSDHLFDKENPPEGGKVVGRDTVVFDIPKPHLSPEFPVVQYLKDKGYAIFDYRDGLARRMGSNRPISIGKVLSRPHEVPKTPFDVNAPEWQQHRSSEFHRQRVLETFTTSDIREAMKTPLQLLVSRDPYKVAEMSSNKPRWTSCMSLGTCPSRDIVGGDDWSPEEEKVPYHQQPGYQRPGQNVRFMGDELLSGTHVAYLIGAGDYELKNPFARISLRPYHNDDLREKIKGLHPSISWRHTWGDIKPAHTILRPSMSIYSSTNINSHGHELLDAFQKSVDRVTRTHFPMRFDVYHKDPMSYLDTGDRRVWHYRHDGLDKPDEKQKETPPAPPGPPGYYEDEDGNIRIR